MPAKQALQVCSFSPVQELYEAAKATVELLEGSRRYKAERLIKAVEEIEKAARENDSLRRVQELARGIYSDHAEDIDIDSASFTHHNGESGYWVGAWLWVSEPDLVEGETDETD